MANVDRPDGFRPVGNLSGGSMTGQVQKFLANEALFLGDLVTKSGTGRSSGDGAYQDCARAGAGNAILGVVVGWEIDPDNLSAVHCAASTTKAVFVNTDPNLILECQSDDGTPVVADVGQNFNIVVASGSTTSGASNMELDGDTGATTAALPLKLIGFTDTPDNDTGSANMSCLVTINNHIHKGHTGTDGV